jgi:hypothetical protein
MMVIPNNLNLLLKKKSHFSSSREDLYTRKYEFSKFIQSGNIGEMA